MNILFTFLSRRRLTPSTWLYRWNNEKKSTNFNDFFNMRDRTHGVPRRIPWRESVRPQSRRRRRTALRRWRRPRNYGTIGNDPPAAEYGVSAGTVGAPLSCGTVLRWRRGRKRTHVICVQQAITMLRVVILRSCVLNKRNSTRRKWVDIDTHISISGYSPVLNGWR